MRVSTEKQPANVFGIAVEIDNHRLVDGEKAIASFPRQSVRVNSGGPKYEQVVDVDYPNPNSDISKDCSGCYHLECDFDSTANQNNVRVDSAVC